MNVNMIQRQQESQYGQRLVLMSSVPAHLVPRYKLLQSRVLRYPRQIFFVYRIEA
jgi:hypothetical protein